VTKVSPPSRDYLGDLETEILVKLKAANRAIAKLQKAESEKIQLDGGSTNTARG
jgi:hypothetical protein